ncbi:MAG TPA: metal ABC transporter permease [Gammaproteobacteria bacterium]|nr:metal ABC transporter permease [Gammaproteobacteria bacterium]
MSFDVTSLSIVGPALLAGMLVLATHVPLGQEVLRRGIIFIDLAVAQMAGLGVIAAHGFGLEAHGVAAQVAAFAAALLGGLLLSWTDRRFARIQEAIIGVSFVLAATGGLLLLANDPRGGEELRDLLVGQILWADVHTLVPAGVLAALVLAAWRIVMRTLRGAGFYLLFAISVTASVQLVGVYLVFASLMVPALATRRLRAHALTAGYAIGVAGYLAGLLLSARFDLPTGAIIVWTLTIAALAAVPLLGRWRRAVDDPLDTAARGAGGGYSAAAGTPNIRR